MRETIHENFIGILLIIGLAVLSTAVLISARGEYAHEKEMAKIGFCEIPVLGSGIDKWAPCPAR